MSNGKVILGHHPLHSSGSAVAGIVVSIVPDFTLPSRCVLSASVFTGLITTSSVLP
jgi:hypothetical protein